MGEVDVGQLEEDVRDNLDDLCYTEMKDLSKAVTEGVANPEFTRLVSYVSDQLKELYEMEETVTDIAGQEDSSSFNMELSSFLRELGCPYTKLTEGAVSER